MIEIILKGFLIGILVSAPMGPIGMLCVQRTLNRGRLHGFATGLGAMVSDIIYATITLTGISFAENFLNKHEAVIQIVGSVVLIYFGYRVFNNNPLKSNNHQIIKNETRYTKDFLTSFALTLSNAAILLIFITLFARFHYNPTEDGIHMLGIALGTIALGAITWWFFLTLLIGHLSKHFSRRSLILLNRVIGIVLIIIGSIGFFI